MPVTTMTVIGPWVMDDGTPASGRVEFKPNATRFINGGDIVAAKTHEYTLDNQGMLNGNSGVALIRNGSIGAAGGYTVTEFIEGGASYTYTLSDSAGPLDLSTLSSAAQPAGLAYPGSALHWAPRSYRSC